MQTKHCPHCYKDIDERATRCPHCQADLRHWSNRHPVLTILGFILGIIIVLVIIGSISGNNSDNTSSSETTSTCPSSTSTLESEATTISYAELNKDPDSYDGQIAEFTGQVEQIQESNGEGYMRISVVNEGDSFWNQSDIIFVTYSGHTNAVDNDIVTVY
ncbi:hypothetical protein KGQ74_01595, partial [Patescibacteria group bacterium]|nr:hypothetical protein [Patescibacteria group bacterium]